jgi:hypothetical protein
MSERTVAAKNATTIGIARPMPMIVVQATTESLAMAPTAPKNCGEENARARVPANVRARYVTVLSRSRPAPEDVSFLVMG